MSILIGNERNSGVLCHITSLPSPYGIGDIGPSAYRFIDDLQSMGQRLWQILPTNPTDIYNCPYSSDSAFANNPYLISIELLLDDGLLSPSDISNSYDYDKKRVDYNSVLSWKKKLLWKAVSRLKTENKFEIDFHQFCDENKHWLDAYSIFQILSKSYHGRVWNEWDNQHKKIKFDTINEINKENLEEINSIKILQFLFKKQWNKLKKYAYQNGVTIIGDIPIYIGFNSADVWSNSHLFKLDQDDRMEVKSGCPPDFFISDGQVWGHPIYKWDLHEKSNFDWWIKRMDHLYKFVDIIRIDHFNGLIKYWEIPANDKNGLNGKWLDGPGDNLFFEIYKQLDNPIIFAEDLGEASLEAKPVREKFKIPGMEILQFSFGDNFPLKNVDKNTVIYTGTHDNDTIVGWFNQKSSNQTDEDFERNQQHAKEVLNLNGQSIHWPMINYALNSNANTTIFPLQDILGLDSSARMNTPGTIEKNWEWRFRESQITEDIKNKMLELTRKSDRI